MTRDTGGVKCPGLLVSVHEVQGKP